MTREELISLKDYGVNLGYVLNNRYDVEDWFTLRLPESDDYDVLLDCTYHKHDKFDISTQPIENLINNYEDYDGNCDTYYVKDTPVEIIKNLLEKRMCEYKTYLNEKELKKIGEDFK